MLLRQFSRVPAFLILVAACRLLPAASAGDMIAVQEEIPVSAISVSSEFGEAQKAANLINHSGLKGDRHDADDGGRTMWHSTAKPAATAPAAGIAAAPAWVRCDFATASAISEIQVWNHNQAGFTTRGFRKTRLYGTADGNSWFALSPASVELPQGGERAFVIPLSTNKPLKGVILAAD